MSVFILDNLGLDTTEVTLQMFAQADLFFVQKNYPRSLEILDSLLLLYPKHVLTDDILFKKAQI
jgi:hypothetical protein